MGFARRPGCGCRVFFVENAGCGCVVDELVGLWA